MNPRTKIAIAAVILAAAGAAVFFHLRAGRNGDGNGGYGPEPSPEPPATTVVEANNAFAVDLYRRLAAEKKREGENLFLSPYSVSTALAMTSTGARGETARQMERVLRFEQIRERVHADLRDLQQELNAGKEKLGGELVVANALWGQRGYGFLPEFLTLTREHYGAALRGVDFGAPGAARRTINDWVKEETRERIKDLIPPGVLSADTRLVLTNAVYMKAAWELPFEKEFTEEAPFHVTRRKTVDVPMMRQTEYFRYLEGDGFQALELTYEEGRLAMVIFLPRKIDGLARLERGLGVGNLGKWLKAMEGRGVEVYLPRFTFVSEFSLAGTLGAMGMPDAFVLGRADFSGMNGRKPPDPESLFIGAVRHKAWVEVDEAGTEAAAATSVEVWASEGEDDTTEYEPPPVFRADHPFLFLIRERETGTILFLGRVVSPAR